MSNRLIGHRLNTVLTFSCAVPGKRGQVEDNDRLFSLCHQKRENTLNCLLGKSVSNIPSVSRPLPSFTRSFERADDVAASKLLASFNEYDGGVGNSQGGGKGWLPNTGSIAADGNGSFAINESGKPCCIRVCHDASLACEHYTFRCNPRIIDLNEKYLPLIERRVGKVTPPLFSGY